MHNIHNQFQKEAQWFKDNTVEAKKKENTEPKSSKRIALPVHLEVIETIIQPKGDLSHA